MRIEVYHRGELLLSVPIEVQKGPFTEKTYEHRKALIKSQVEIIKGKVSKIVGPKEIEICLVAGSSMNHRFWNRLSVFEDVEEWIKKTA